MLILRSFVFVTASLLLNGAVLHYLWDWFVTPVFGITAPNILVASGLCLLTMHTTFNSIYLTFDSQDTDKELRLQRLAGFFHPVLILILGYFLHLFI